MEQGGLKLIFLASKTGARWSLVFNTDEIGPGGGGGTRSGIASFPGEIIQPRTSRISCDVGTSLGPEKYGYVRLDRQTPYPLPFMSSCVYFLFSTVLTIKGGLSISGPMWPKFTQPPSGKRNHSSPCASLPQRHGCDKTADLWPDCVTSNFLTGARDVILHLWRFRGRNISHSLLFSPFYMTRWDYYHPFWSRIYY